MVDVEIFGRVGLIKWKTVDGVPENASENKEIVIGSVEFKHHGDHRKQHPKPKDDTGGRGKRGWIRMLCRAKSLYCSFVLTVLSYLPTKLKNIL